jgi:hypothetical protein
MKTIVILISIGIFWGCNHSSKINDEAIVNSEKDSIDIPKKALAFIIANINTIRNKNLNYFAKNNGQICFWEANSNYEFRLDDLLENDNCKQYNFIDSTKDFFMTENERKKLLLDANIDKINGVKKYNQKTLDDVMRETKDGDLIIFISKPLIYQSNLYVTISLVSNGIAEESEILLRYDKVGKFMKMISYSFVI